MKVSKFGNLMMGVSAMLSIALLVSCKKDNNDNGRNYTVSGNAGGNQMVPAVGGTGNATITGTYNDRSNVLNYTTSWNGLSGTPISGNFYRGTLGMNGTTLGTEWTYPSGTMATGTRSGSMTLSEAQEADFKNGQWYYSFGTTANPNGEVRGQMIATPQ